MMNGPVRVVLTAWDFAGNVGEDEKTVYVKGENKFGVMRISFIDLETELAGVPIVIQRTYDSRWRHQALDFGYGWKLDVVTGGAYVYNRPAGEGWEVLGNQLNPCVYGRATRYHVIEIRFSETEFYRFTPVFTPTAPLTGGCEGRVTFVQTGGLPGGKLEVDGTNQVIWDEASGNLYEAGLTEVFIPKRVHFIRREGEEYWFEDGVGLRKIRDRHGNGIDIERTGSGITITHTSGAGITMTRTNGRITSITDMEGRSITYSYDGATDNLIIELKIKN